MRPERRLPERRPGGRRAGFSLIETLAALAVTGALAGALLPFAGTVLAHWTRAPEIAETGDRYLQAASLLQDDFLEALPLSGTNGAPMFRAGADCVELVRPALGSKRTGLEHMRYAIVRAGGFDVLTRASAPLRRGEDIGALPSGNDQKLLEGRWFMRFVSPGASQPVAGPMSAAMPARMALVLSTKKNGPPLRTFIFALPARFPTAKQNSPTIPPGEAALAVCK